MNKFLLIIIGLIFNILNAQPPQDPPSNFKVTTAYAWKVAATLSVPSASSGAIMVISTSPISNINLAPGNEYKLGHRFGNAKVVKVLNRGFVNFEITGLVANTKYFLAFYSFNNNGQYEYLNTPYYASFTTKGKDYGTYYSSLNVDAPNFLSSLSSLLRNHNAESYYNFATNLVYPFYEMDTLVNGNSMKYVKCEYSNEISVYSPPFLFSNMAIDFNREHILPKNWMNFRKDTVNNSDLVKYAEGADYHNLALTQGTRVNSRRSDYPLDIVVKDTLVLTSALYGKNASNSFCFEPQSNFKGNAARAMFYQMVTYNGMDNHSWGLDSLLFNAKLQKQAVLKAWAAADTPDNFEIARNELIYSVQNNRNPFVDFPKWIECIDFSKIVLLNKCQAFSSKINENEKAWDVLYFVQNEQLNINFNFPYTTESKLNIYDLRGSLVFSKNQRINSGNTDLQFNLSYLESGIYLFTLQAGDYMYKSKLNK
jgi:endonuclease I